MKHPKLWSRRNVPQDLWPEILSRLPVKTLLRFRCVSKQWRELIDDPDFARLHLRLFSNNRSETHFFDWLEEPVCKSKLQVRCIKTLRVTSRLRVPQSIYHNGKYWYALYSTDGLVMLTTDRGARHEDVMLWNPATGKTLTLPPSPEISTHESRLCYINLGLGLDPSTKHYKHVIVSHIRTVGVHSIGVYSLATNSWKMTRCCHQDTLQRLDNVVRGLSLEGFLFCLATISGSVKELISFDLRSDTLASISLPAQDGDVTRGISTPGLTVADGGCSVAVVFCSKGSGSVWVLEGLGADDIKSCTWSRRYTFSSMIPDLDRHTGEGSFFCLRKNGELLIKWNGMITSHNLKTNEGKVVGKRKFAFGYMALPYVESLLPITN